VVVAHVIGGDAGEAAGDRVDETGGIEQGVSRRKRVQEPLVRGMLTGKRFRLKTASGVILGTATYMAPKQARGRTVDQRADIWAYGVVLYELLTGKRLLEGATISDTLAQVLTKDPDLSQAPAKVRKLLRRSLEKDPKHRLRDIGDPWE
jgi:serine/threonine protein kinase